MYRFRSVVVLAVVLVVSLLGLASWLILNRVAKDAQASLGQSLSMVLDTTHQTVKSWVREQQTVATVWAGAPEVRDAVSDLLTVPPTRDALAESRIQAELRRRLSSVYAAKGYQGYFVIGPGSINFASNHDAELGAPNLLAEKRGFLDRVWAGTAAVSLPLVSDVPLPDGEGRPPKGWPSMLAASPIRGDDGRVMAVLAFRIDPAADFSALFRQRWPGTTGETYAFDKQGRLITESRFDEQLRRIGLLPVEGRSILNIELRDPGRALTEAEPSNQGLVHGPMTSMARQAIAGTSGMDLGGYRDYRGVVVVGAWLWDKSLGLGIASEMDVSEAYAPLRTVQHVIAGLTALSALLLLVLSAAFVINRGRIVDRERRLRQIIDLVPSMIFAKGRDGRFLLANAAVADAYGTSPEAIIHTSHQDLHKQAAEVQAMLADDREVIDSGRTKFIPEEAFLDAHGRQRILQTVKIPYQTSGRGQHAVLGVAMDITARKRAEEALTRERDRAQQYLDIVGVMVVVVGADCRVSLINQKGCEVLGYDEADILGKDWFANFLPERMRVEVGQGFDSLIRGELSPMEYYENPVITRGGEERLIAWHNTLVRGESGRILATLSSGEDITERRKLEDRRNRFVSIASHELRTPLTNISLSLELLLREATPEISERARGMLDIARRSSERLTRVVNDLLDLQRLEAGKTFFDLKPVALLPLMQEAIESSRAYAEQFDVRYVLVSERADVRVQGDSDGLIRVITNLLSNAARFSPAGASVDVDLSCSANRVRVSVTDRGPGIPEDFRELVFEPFAQVEPSLEDPRHKGSSGLGLSISKAIVERHGGEIGFDSQPGRATTFYFELNEWGGL